MHAAPPGSNRVRTRRADPLVAFDAGARAATRGCRPAPHRPGRGALSAHGAAERNALGQRHGPDRPALRRHAGGPDGRARRALLPGTLRRRTTGRRARPRPRRGAARLGRAPIPRRAAHHRHARPAARRAAGDRAPGRRRPARLRRPAAARPAPPGCGRGAGHAGAVAPLPHPRPGHPAAPARHAGGTRDGCLRGRHDRLVHRLRAGRVPALAAAAALGPTPAAGRHTDRAAAFPARRAALPLGPEGAGRPAAAAAAMAARGGRGGVRHPARPGAADRARAGADQRDRAVAQRAGAFGRLLFGLPGAGLRSTPTGRC